MLKEIIKMINSDLNIGTYIDLPNVSRENKGHSVLKSLSDYVVIYIETTGLDPYWDEIIEIAALRVKNNIIVDNFQSLVNPSEEIDDFITDLTGITNDMLLNAPKIEDVLSMFVEYVGANTIIAHNANFDINFLYDNCNEHLNIDFSNDFIDTMRLSRLMFKNFSRHTLQELARQFNMSQNIEHRALSDANVTYKCYDYMKKYATENSIDFNSLKKYSSQVRAKDITTQKVDFDEATLTFGKQFVFTGTLEKMTRKKAMQYVVDMGGSCGDNVTMNTNYLVLGNND